MKVSNVGKLNLVVDDRRARVVIRLVGQLEQKGLDRTLTLIKRLIDNDVDLPNAQYETEVKLLDETQWMVFKTNVSEFKRHFDALFTVEEGKPDRVLIEINNAQHRVKIECPSIVDFTDRVLNLVAIKATLQEYFTKPEYWGKVW